MRLWEDIKYNRLNPRVRRFYAVLALINIFCAVFGVVGWMVWLNVAAAALLARIVLLEPSDHRVLPPIERKELR